jgi:hypothetical protein
VANVAALTKADGSGRWSNYTLTTTGAKTTTADITKKDVTLDSLTADSKTYDSATTANISAGVISGTVVSEALLISGAGNFSDANPASGKTVTVADVSALKKTNTSTGDWDNYNLTTTGAKTTTATIIPVADNCARSSSGCAAIESSPIPKANLGASPPTLLAARVDPQLVKQPTDSVASSNATIPPTSFFLTAPISSTTTNVKALTPTQIAELPATQLAPLIKSLDRSQLLAITEKQMSGLNVAQLDELIALLNLAAKPTK